MKLVNRSQPSPLDNGNKQNNKSSAQIYFHPKRPHTISKMNDENLIKIPEPCWVNYSGEVNDVHLLCSKMSTLHDCL